MLRSFAHLVSRRGFTFTSPSHRRANQMVEALECRQLLSASVTTLATFAGIEGDPNSDGGTLIADSAGNLYGTVSGQSFGNTIIFELPAGSRQIKTLASFTGYVDASGLVMDPAGNLYGEVYGAENSALYGRIFELPAGSDSIETLAVFNGSNGAQPAGGLSLDAVGNLYGTCYDGGTYGDGTVFEVSSSGAIDTLYNFPGSASSYNNGTYPLDGVVLDSLGNIYGTTSNSGPNQNGDGTVFEIAVGTDDFSLMAGSYNGLVPAYLTLDSQGDFFGANGNSIVEIPAGGAAITLATFSGNTAIPGPLVLDQSGDLFGELREGGDDGVGSIFEVVAGSGTVTTVASFTGTDSSGSTGPEGPEGGLVLDSSGNIFGLAAAGGLASELPNVFEVTPNGAPTASFTLTPPANQEATAGVAQTFNLGSFTAANTTAPYTVSINWGDGSYGTTEQMNSAGTIPPQSYTYSQYATGTMYVTVSVGDAVGHISEYVTFSVNISTAPVGTPGLTILIHKSTVPTSLVADSKLKGAITFDADNSTGANITGPATITVYATDSSGDQTAVGKVTRRLNLHNNKSVAIGVPMLPIALPSGTYTLQPQLTAGTDTASVTGPTVSVAQAFVSLAATLSAVKPAIVSIKKPGSLIVTLSNSGNVSATGLLTLTLSPSADGASAIPGVTLATLTRRVAIKPGRSGKFAIRFKITDALASGVYYLFITAALDSASTTAVGPVPFTAG